VLKRDQCPEGNLYLYNGSDIGVLEMIGGRTCYNNDLSLQTRTVGIWSNLLEDGDVFELALVRNWSYELLTDC